MLKTTGFYLLSLAFALTHAQQQYGVRMRWTSNAQGCTDPPAEIDYWPIGSPFGFEGSGTCVDVPMNDGGHAYYTYSTVDSIPEIPSSWPPFYATQTFYENRTECDAGQDIFSTTISSDACIFSGASTMGYYYLRLACSSETESHVYSCRDAACKDCRAPNGFVAGCDSNFNAVNTCPINPNFNADPIGVFSSPPSFFALLLHVLQQFYWVVS
eukprot:Phypoly_transcript_08078.p1 GENE.Phypoly_transcript_08078~~Phypoly_transcript_08078.p1  ORF type:complete len:213 (+),score=25.35 Phypoly_transcript_08078:74-712(+)